MYALLRSPYVQTSLVGYITNQIEKNTGVKIGIGGVDFRPMSSLVLQDVLLSDFKKDTLLYCRNVRVKADSFSVIKRTFTIRELTLEKAVFNLWVSGDGSNITNVEMWLDSLLKKQTSPENIKPVPADRDSWLIGLQKITLLDSRFTYREEVFEPEEYGVNWTDVDCRELNMEISGLNFAESPARFVVSDLCLKEKSGLVIKNMGGKVRVTDSTLLVTDSHFEFSQSEVDLVKLEFRWKPNRHDWKYFTTRMQQYYELGPSSVSFIDLAYFNGVLRGINNTVKCSGIVSNTINQLEGHDLYFELGERSIFQGNFKSAGLPDVWNTVFNIELYKAHLGPADLATVYLPWFNMNIPVPGPFYHLPSLDFEKIAFNGTLSDFIVKAKSVTPDLSGNLSFAYHPCEADTTDCSALDGGFNFEQVDFRKFSGLSILGRGQLNGSYAGVWDKNGPFVHMNAKLDRLNIHQGTVHGIDIALTWTDDQLDLIASVEDKILRGGMVMAYDMRDSLNFLSVRGKVELPDLAALGFDLREDQESAATTFDLVHAGRKNRSFTNLTLSDLHYTNRFGRFDIRRLCMEDSQYRNYNTTTLKSDILDLSIEGNYKEVRPLPFVVQLMRNYLPAYSVKKGRKIRKDNLKHFDFEYAVEVKDANRILKVLYPGVSISPGTKISSRFRRGNENLELSVLADTIRYEDISLIKSKVDLSGDPRQLKIDYAADRVVYGNGYQLYNVRNTVRLADNHLDNRLSWCNWEERTYSGELSACIAFVPDDKNDYRTEITINPGVIVMDDSVWRMNESSIRIAGKEITVNDFSIRRGEEYLFVKGKLSEDPAEKMYVNLQNFKLENFARIALKHRLSVFGLASGSLILQDYYRDFLLLSDFYVRDWGIDRDTLGSLRFRSYWDAENKSLIVGAENQVGNEIPLLVSGMYRPATDSLDVSMKLKKVGLERLGMYASDFVSDTRGFLSGNVHIGGTSHMPDVSGSVYLDSVDLKVNALNTRFSVHDSVRIVQNRFLFDHFRLKDLNGNEAFLNGEYDMLEDRYRLNANYQHFMVLNTGFADNESFYGQMYLSGLAELDNRNGVVNVTVNARTENNSRLYIPLSASLAEQDNNFLHFIHTGQEEVRKVQAVAGSDINLDANLEVDEHLNVQVIFDPTVGDVLKTTGKGDLKISFDKDGSLSMFGEYRITKGDYLFTLSNLVNKKFVLTPGGTINWSGSPYEAMLDINAVYSLKTTISELLPAENIITEESGTTEEKSTESNRKVPVECILNLSENLTNPVVKFDINFPSLETQSKSYLQSLFSSQDEINKQMFSLLVLNRFYRTDNTDDYGNQAQTAGVTTLTEMFTNQLSRWFSQLSSNLDIGFAYRFGDRDKEMTSDELELAVSTQLLNDRVTISANGNMDVGGNKNAPAEDKKNNIAGDFDVEVKLNKQGTLKMKAYSHTNEKLLYNNTETIQGVGVSYQESFDTLRELLRKYFGFLQKKK